MEAGGLHVRTGYNDRIEIICWSADSTRLATAAHGDMSTYREIVLWDAAGYRPLKDAARASADERWAMHPHSRFGTHGRTSFGFGPVDCAKGYITNVFYNVSEDRAYENKLDRTYDGESFDWVLAESHCGRYRVVGKLLGFERKTCLLFAVRNDEDGGGGTVLAYLGGEVEWSKYAAIEPAAGGRVVRVVLLRGLNYAVPEVFEIDPGRPGPELAAGERPDPGTLEGKLGADEEEMEAAWACAVRVGRRRPRFLGVLSGHAADLWAGRFLEGGDKFVSYDRQDLRLWDLSFLDAETAAREAAAGDAAGNFSAEFPELLAAAPLVLPPSSAPASSSSLGGSLRGGSAFPGAAGSSLGVEPLIASLRADGRLSLVRCPAGRPEATVLQALPGESRPWGLAALAAASKGASAHVLAASADGLLRAVHVRPAGSGLAASEPVELRLRLPCALTALAASPGAGPLCALPDALEAFVGAEDGGVHAFVIRLGPSPGAARRASWFHGGPVVSIATSAADPRAAGGASHTHVASLSLDGSVALATLPAAPAAACSVALVDRLPLAPGGGPGATRPHCPAGRAFEKRVLRSHADAVRALAFASGPGDRLVSLGADGGVRVWEAATGRLAYRLGLWRTEEWSCAALDGVSRRAAPPPSNPPSLHPSSNPPRRAGAIGVCVGNSAMKLDIFDVVSLESGEPEEGEAAPAAAPSGGDVAAAHLPLRAYAQGYKERYTFSVGEQEILDKASCWLDYNRTLRGLPPGRYSLSFEIKITAETDTDALHFRVSGPAVSNRPREEDFAARAERSDWRRPLDWSRGFPTSEQAPLEGKGWVPVPLAPVRVARGSDVLVRCCHLTGNYKNKYGFGRVRVRPVVAGLPEPGEAPGPDPWAPAGGAPGAGLDAPGARLEWTALRAECPAGAPAEVAALAGLRV
eukprot:tig00001208_g7540.t1